MKPKPEKLAKLDSPLARAKAKFPRTGHLMQAYLDEYEKTENSSLSGKTAGVGHTTISEWRKDEDFMVVFTEAHLRAQKKNNDNLRASATQRAINGSPHYLIRNGAFVLDANGERIVAYRDFETQLTMFMMKNRMPDEFRDKYEHEISGQILLSLASEFSAILKKHVPVQFMPAIQKELETLSAKFATT